MRYIAHVDMDAFFASVELLKYPQLQSIPVVVGGSGGKASEDLAQLAQQYTAAGELGSSTIPIDAFPRISSYRGRGVITTCNYAARAFGIASAMGVMKAAQRCPEAILLPADMAAYKQYSQMFKQVIGKYSDKIENRGIDEVYVDLSDHPLCALDGGVTLAQHIKLAIFDATTLTCSIGIAPNKLLAKLASEMNKPNGITVLTMDDVATHVWPLMCRKLNGIGPKSAAKLEQLGILTLGDLARCEPHWLISQFGQRYGEWLYHASQGIDERSIVTHSEPVSLSRETTFARDLSVRQDRVQLNEVFTVLCQRVANDLARRQLATQTIGVKIKLANFKIVTRVMSAPHAIYRAEDIRHYAALARKRGEIDQPIRLLGVRVSKLSVRSTMSDPTSDQLHLDL